MLFSYLLLYKYILKQLKYKLRIKIYTYYLWNFIKNLYWEKILYTLFKTNTFIIHIYI